MGAELSDRVLAWCLSDTDAYTMEQCEWSSPDSSSLLQFYVAEFIEHQLDSFYAEFSECFNLAEFPDVAEQLRDCEVSTFLASAGAPADADVSSIEDDCFFGLRGVIRSCLKQGGLRQLKRAAELFNWTIDCGLFNAETHCRAEVRVGSVEEVAPFLLDRIVGRTLSSADDENTAHLHSEQSFEKRFLPVIPVLRMVKDALSAPDLGSNRLALEILFWIAGIYKVQLEKEIA